MKEAHRNSGKKASSKSSSGRGAFSIEKKDNNAHVGKIKKGKNDGKGQNFLWFFLLLLIFPCILIWFPVLS